MVKFAKTKHVKFIALVKVHWKELGALKAYFGYKYKIMKHAIYASFIVENLGDLK